jgi:3-mercaptopyruvate sulfurtransferase SseA
VWKPSVLHNICLIMAGVLLTGCQMKPTRVIETRHREYQALVDKTRRPLRIEDDTIVLDARSAFDYGLNRVNGAVHFPWENLAENASTSELLRDPRKAALRLSLLGLEPAKPVVIVGYGPSRGSGEEGRLAWNLLYLGFQDVQVVSVDSLRNLWTRIPTPQRQNVPAWEPNPRPELLVDKMEFERWGKDPKGRASARVFLLDVRSEREYFNRDKKGSSTPDWGALNVEWSQFYDRDGRPEPMVRKRLEGLGVRLDDRVIVVCNRGVRSAAAAYALMALGYRRVQIFNEGWNAIRLPSTSEKSR